jgi:hypothetical protein
MRLGLSVLPRRDSAAQVSSDEASTLVNNNIVAAKEACLASGEIRCSNAREKTPRAKTKASCK